MQYMIIVAIEFVVIIIGISLFVRYYNRRG